MSAVAASASAAGPIAHLSRLWRIAGRQLPGEPLQGMAVGGDADIMRAKEHGTSHRPVQGDLRWDCSFSLADRTCNYNRTDPEPSGHWRRTRFLEQEAEVVLQTRRLGIVTSTTWGRRAGTGPEVHFYDANSGALLFHAPTGRSFDAFVQESRRHGWLSFRDEEANWERVRVLDGGECVSVDGTHLGHNEPDGKGNRYSVNIVAVAGKRVA